MDLFLHLFLVSSTYLITDCYSCGWQFYITKGLKYARYLDWHIVFNYYEYVRLKLQNLCQCETGKRADFSHFRTVVLKNYTSRHGAPTKINYIPIFREERLWEHSKLLCHIPSLILVEISISKTPSGIRKSRFCKLIYSYFKGSWVLKSSSVLY